MEVEMELEEKAPCCRRHKERTEDTKKDMINRLRRIEGQIRGIKGMLEKDAYCADILTQSAAVTAALNAFNRELLSSHVHSCVVRDIRSGDDGVVDELIGLMQKLMR